MPLMNIRFASFSCKHFPESSGKSSSHYLYCNSDLAGKVGCAFACYNRQSNNKALSGFSGEKEDGGDYK